MSEGTIAGKHPYGCLCVQCESMRGVDARLYVGVSADGFGNDRTHVMGLTGGAEPERIVPRYEQIWISRSDFEELERHAGELERQLLDLTAERDRLLKGLTDAALKLKVYRREIRRLQRALLVERGRGLGELEARVEALEGDGK